MLRGLLQMIQGNLDHAVIYDYAKIDELTFISTELLKKSKVSALGTVMDSDIIIINQMLHQFE